MAPTGYNQFTGKLPTEVGNLGALEIFDIGMFTNESPKNDFKKAYVKVVPHPAMQLAASNSLTGPIPSELGMLVELEKLGKLRNEGIITEEEFQSCKRKFLRGI